MSRLGQLLRYASSVYDLPHLLKGVRDTRDKARTRIATSGVICAWILAFCVRVRSREQMGRLLDRRAVQKLFGGHISSDTLGRVLKQVDTDSLRSQLLVPLIRQMRRNKAWRKGTVAGQVLIGIDGSEAFHSSHRHCPKCSQRRTGGAEKVTEYYHRAVWAFIIGTEPRVYLDVEPLQPGEGEGPAAMRLLERVGKHFGSWINGVVVDSGYVSAPFLSLARRLKLHYIVRIKQERNHLRRRAEALCSQRAPDARWQERIGHRRLHIEAWDEEGLWSWHRLWSRVRVVVCHEVELAEAVSPRRQVARRSEERR